MSIKVMIVDDHAMIRQGIKNLIEFEGDIKVVAEAGDGKECLQYLKKDIPDVLLLDINMPEKNGIEVLKKIRKDEIDIKVLILTVHNEIEYLIKAVDMGVNGYVLKDSDSNELITAIREVYMGIKYIQPTLIPTLNSKLITRNLDKEKIEELTNREIEVLVQLSSGLFNKEIASNLSISERTVKNHISNIFKKLEVSDRTQAAVFAIRNDLIQLH